MAIFWSVLYYLFKFRPDKESLSGKLSSGERYQVAHIHAAAGAIIRTRLPRLHCDCARPHLSGPKAEHRAARLPREHVGLVQNRLRRRIGAVDTKTTLPSRPLPAVEISGVAHMGPDIETVPVVIVAACPHPTSRLAQ